MGSLSISVCVARPFVGGEEVWVRAWLGCGVSATTNCHNFSDNPPAIGTGCRPPPCGRGRPTAISPARRTLRPLGRCGRSGPSDRGRPHDGGRRVADRKAKGLHRMGGRGSAAPRGRGRGRSVAAFAVLGELFVALLPASGVPHQRPHGRRGETRRIISSRRRGTIVTARGRSVRRPTTRPTKSAVSSGAVCAGGGRLGIVDAASYQRGPYAAWADHADVDAAVTAVA